MIIDELVLHDFGQYRGRNSVQLRPPSPEQPVVLFGGLNGAGKTTLLDAIQLCLFGPSARSLSREGLAYEAFLAECIHRGAGATGASVEIAFRHMADGEEQHYRVKRSWSRSGKGCREKLEVIRNFKFDPIATENWAEQVEEFIPARIAHLFFFDGEKIGGYADPRSSAGLIETAVYNLLGLDLVEKLGSDLSVLERRRKLEQRDQAERAEIDAAEQAKVQLEVKCSEQAETAARIRTSLGQITTKLDQIEDKYRKEGGHLYDQRRELEIALDAARQQHASVERELREIAGGAAPLLLVKGLLQQVAQQDTKETQQEDAGRIGALLEERDHQLLELISSKSAEPSLLKAVSDFVELDRTKRLHTEGAPYLNLSEIGRASLRALQSGAASETKLKVAETVASERKNRSNFEEAAARLAAVPTADALAGLTATREQLRANRLQLEAELRLAHAELEKLHRDLERQTGALDRLHQAHSMALIDQDDLARALKHSARVRTTLDRFKEAMVGRHLSRIEELVLDSFRQLLRKKTLVSKLSIDRETFQLRLENSAGEILSPDRLSAGERQLLAVSILWGLARASGRPLPAVIDTPLGRLDSSHRRRLVTHYFPHASHQVLLLSTDEEISGGYLKALQPYVGRFYSLNFDESSGATSIQDGYFEERPEYVH